MKRNADILGAKFQHGFVEVLMRRLLCQYDHFGT